MLNLKIVKAITLDLDDTLWPVWPTIQRAEKALEHWLKQHAPATAVLFANASVRDESRSQLVSTRPELKHNLSALRREYLSNFFMSLWSRSCSGTNTYLLGC